MSLVDNKKAFFNYEVGEKYEAGMELLGPEVKSLKNRQGSLEGAFVIIRGGEAFLVGAYIPPYQPKNMPKGYDPTRARRLLLSKKEIIELATETQANKLTIVPISVYNKGTKVKLSLGLAKRKKKYDKREAIKKRDTERDLGRSLKK